jgi:hypothetical protein
MAKKTRSRGKGRKVSAPARKSRKSARRVKRFKHRKAFISKPQLQKKFNSTKRSLRTLRKKYKVLEAAPKEKPLPAAIRDIASSVDELRGEIASRTEQFQEIAGKDIKS